MPFTPSHVAAVLPARWIGLPLSALAIGSMAPDIPYFFMVPALEVVSSRTHTPSGVVTIDLLLGLTAWIVWKVVLEAPAAALAPAWVRGRLDEGWRPGLRPALASPAAAAGVVVALVVGSATHVVWDAFTHLDAWGPANIAILRTEVVPGYTGARVVQYLSSALGLLVVGASIGWWVLRTPPRPVPASRNGWLVPLVLAGVGLAMGTAAALGTVLSGQGKRRALFDAATVGGAAVVGTAAVIAVGWHLAAAVRSVSPTSGGPTPGATPGRRGGEAC